MLRKFAPSYLCDVVMLSSTSTLATRGCDPDRLNVKVHKSRLTYASKSVIISTSALGNKLHVPTDITQAGSLLKFKFAVKSHFGVAPSLTHDYLFNYTLLKNLIPNFCKLNWALVI